LTFQITYAILALQARGTEGGKMKTKEQIAEDLGVDVEDLCVKCGEDEIYNSEICIGCLEGQLEQD
jgi:hypothetical protein